MSRDRSLHFLPVLAVLVCVLFDANSIGAAETTRIQAVSLGVIAETNRAQIEDHFGDFARYVAGKLDSTSDIQGKVVIVPTAFILAKLMEQRQIDFYTDSPYPTYLVNNVYGVAKLLLRRWKGGMAEYRSLIFTRRNGTVHRLEDLRGKIMVFEDPESTSGYFLPHSFLTRKGFNFTDKSRFDPYAAPTDIGYLFAYSQEQLIQWVLAQKTAAGAFSDHDYARLDKKERSELAILAQTEALPRHLVSVRSDFSPALADRLKNILLSMHENDQGRRILKKTDDTTKFDLLPEGDVGLRRKFAEIFDANKRR